MTIKNIIIFGIMVFSSSFYQSDAKPMDSRAAEKLPALKAIVHLVRDKKPMKPENIETLRAFLNSENAVLISISAWCVFQLGEQGDALQSEISTLLGKFHELDMTYAFLELAKQAKDLQKFTLSQRKERFEKLLVSKNSFLKLEASNILLQMNVDFGKKALKELILNKENDGVAGEAFHNLEKISYSEVKGIKMPGVSLSMFYEEYGTVLRIIREENR